MKNSFTFISLIAILVFTCTFSPANGQWVKNIIDPSLDGSCFIYIADIDSDNDLDVAATGYLANRVVWYENDGTLPVNWIKHTIDSLYTSPHGIHAADIDADGDSDLVVAEYSTHKVVWFENLGGTPIIWSKHVIDSYLQRATKVMVEDIDSDGDLDVAATPYDDDCCYWYENNLPNTNWSKHTIDNNGGGHLRFVDMDGDSAVDLVTTGKIPLEVVWYKNNLPNTNWTKTIIDTNPPGVRQIRVGDIDGDADPDVVITTGNADMVVWYKNEDGTSLNWSSHTIDDDLDLSAGLDLTDLDGDTILDVVASGYDADDVVWYKNSLPDTRWTKYYIDANLNGAANLKTIDFDSDGDPDVFVVGQNDDVVAWYTNMRETAYAKAMQCWPKYVPLSGDTVIIKAEVYNPANHQVTVHAIISDIQNSFTDSLQLYDDGQHNDSLAFDNIWGNSKYFAVLTEDFYTIGISTHDIDDNYTFLLQPIPGFTTIGPIVFDQYRITSSDTIPHNTNRLKFEFFLRNDDVSATANNITSQLVALDTFSAIYPLTTTNYGSIQPGSTAVGNEKQYIKFIFGDDIDSTYVKFRLDISSDGYLFWSDIFSVFVHRDTTGIKLLDQHFPKKFALKQNYPNPFNPSTTIEFSLPKSEFVTLKIFNMLGQEVTTLVSDKLKSGTYQYTWDAGSLASGVYIYHLQTENYTETRKMVLMR